MDPPYYRAVHSSPQTSTSGNVSYDGGEQLFGLKRNYDEITARKRSNAKAKQITANQSNAKQPAPYLHPGQSKSKMLPQGRVSHVIIQPTRVTCSLRVRVSHVIWDCGDFCLQLGDPLL